MIRAGVIGVGRFGRFHAEKYARLPGVELIGVHDLNLERAAEVGNSLGVPGFPTLEALLAAVDLVSVAVPAQQHYSVGWECLRRGVHLLLEKPMATNPADARALVHLARERKLVLQIGYLERYNPVLQSLRHQIDRPRAIFARRAGPYAHRHCDVDVVLDLMVHDIDLVLDLVAAPGVVTAASAASVRNGILDVATASIQFADGCVAQFTADRLAGKVERQMRILTADRCIEVDFAQHRYIVQHRDSGATPAAASMTRIRESPPTDALLLQIEDFVRCVRDGQAPRVDGAGALRTLEIVQAIGDLLGAAQLPTRSPAQAKVLEGSRSR